MFKLIKYLKDSIFAIILIVGLLVVQAACDLSLPDYTSHIVNVGIQQGGVENPTPNIIRKTEMDKIQMFMNDSDKEKVNSNYELLSKDKLSQLDYQKYEKDYPLLEKEDLYKLNTENKDDIEKLNLIMSKPILTVESLESKEIGDKIKSDMQKNMPPGMTLPKDADVISIIKTMPKAQFDEMTKKINEKFNDMPDSIVNQSAISYVKNEYKSIGIDVDAMQSRYILVAGAKMLGIALVSMVATVAVVLIASRVAAGLGRRLRGKVFKKVVTFSDTELSKFSTASLITRSTNDIQQIQLLMVMVLRMVFYAPILGVGAFIKVLNTDTSMAWIIGVAVGAIILVVGILFGSVMPKFKIMQKLVDKVNLVTREILTGLLVIRAFGTEKHEEKRFDDANTNLTKTNLFVTRTMALMMPLMMVIMNVISVVIVWNGSHSVDNGTMQVGNMMAFIQYTMQIIMAFLMISMMSIMLPRAAVSAGRIDEVLNTESTMNDPETAKEFDNGKKGLLEFKNVSFKYPDADEYMLNDISFTAKPGETTAIIGGTGCGKSTLVNLIPRFYDATDGEILVDGVNIKDVKQHDLRQKIGYVPQKGVLFSGTIESNLRYGAKNATDDVIEKAAEVAQATEFILSKPDKFETDISQGGSNVSGGQKQRLSIARAIAKNPDIYIFDDSFSALDFKTDATLRKALKEHTSNATVLIVAQRISTILHADKIIVLDEGKMVGCGTHKELLNSCEVYEEIAKSQLSKEELANE